LVGEKKIKIRHWNEKSPLIQCYATACSVILTVALQLQNIGCVLCMQDGRTLVHIAAQNGHAVVLSMLLDKHFDASSHDKVHIHLSVLKG